MECPGAQVKKVANNTYKIDTGNQIRYRLHSTDVVTIDRNGVKTLNSGGWKTNTTKDRISLYGAAINQIKGVWYVGDVPYFDGIKVKDGKVINPKKVNLKKIEAMKERIDKFVNKLNPDFLPIPSNGDCFYCSFHDDKGVAMGDLFENDHLLMHIKEGYMPGSLLVNAMRERGYKDVGIQLHYKWKDVTVFKRALKKYLLKRLVS